MDGPSRDRGTAVKGSGMSAPSTDPNAAPPKSPLQEIVQPFVDLLRAPRALWGVNVGYFLEGFVYFGILTYLGMYFNEYVGLGDIRAGQMVGVLTAGITISMFLFGGLSDRWGVRVAMIAAFALMVFGRVLMAGAPSLGPGGWLSSVHIVAMVGILIVVLGYGMYQPAAYAAVRQFTTPATAGMAYAMLYALMNLGGFLPTFMAPVRNAVGISGAFWVYVGFTVVSLLATAAILSQRTVDQAIAAAKAAAPTPDQPASTKSTSDGAPNAERREIETLAVAAEQASFSVGKWLRNHPLADPKFAFFIFCLIPVQTLFAHNWLTLPMYVARAYSDSWLGKNFEVATNFNPILIFILVPIVAAVTQKRKVYNMMIAGTFVMGAPTFLLAFGPSIPALAGYLIIMTIGEAMWQPRFLQYAAEIAPPGRTGAYMGVAQFPWFLTKLIVPLYSGWFLHQYCPQDGPTHTEQMWLIYGAIAMLSTVLLVLAKPWIGRDFKTQA
jgi:proton-dependent oligopeptide transporter, POT family